MVEAVIRDTEVVAVVVSSSLAIWIHDLTQVGYGGGGGQSYGGGGYGGRGGGGGGYDQQQGGGGGGGW